MFGTSEQIRRFWARAGLRRVIRMVELVVRDELSASFEASTPPYCPICSVQANIGEAGRMVRSWDADDLSGARHGSPP
jgi:hypothetical protein